MTCIWLLMAGFDIPSFDIPGSDIATFQPSRCVKPGPWISCGHDHYGIFKLGITVIRNFNTFLALEIHYLTSGSTASGVMEVGTVNMLKTHDKVTHQVMSWMGKSAKVHTKR
jgi:hypothetical protein